MARNSHNIARWKNEFITRKILKKNKLPYYENWFKNSNGESIKRSIYEYLRDYLGYVFVMDNLKIDNQNGKTEISFVITNYGLGTPLTIKNMEFVVANKADGVIDESSAKSYYISAYDCKKLTTYGQQRITFTVNGDISNMAIGVKLSRGKYNIKTANDIPFMNGVNNIY